MKSKKLSEKIIKTFKSNGFILSEPDILLTQNTSFKDQVKISKDQC